MSLVKDVLTGGVSVDLRRDQRSVFDYLVEEWEMKKDRAELEAGFRELIFDPDPHLKSAAVEFFAGRNANDEGLMLKALQDSPEEFRNVNWGDGQVDGHTLVLRESGGFVGLSVTSNPGVDLFRVLNRYDLGKCIEEFKEGIR